MRTVRTREDLKSTCRIIFGPHVRVTSDFLLSLRPDDLKEIYRKKAMENHPDRAQIEGRDESEMNERFKQINIAYEKLYRYLQENNRFFPGPARTADMPKVRFPDDDFRDRSLGDFWKGRVPKQELLIGHYLYYSGMISWEDLQQAVEWQKKQRPKFGRIATLWGYLAEDDVSMALKNRTIHERIGQTAVRMGYITPYQCNAILGMQSYIQRPIGEFFVQNGFLGVSDMKHAARKQRSHNSRYAFPKRSSSGQSL